MAKMAKCDDLGEEREAKLTADLELEILMRTEVSPLMRCRFVCKDWLNLIESPIFVDKYFTHGSRNPRIFVTSSEKGNHTLSALTYDTLRVIVSQDSPFKPLDQTFLKICEPCNGLLCLIDRNCDILLCNPARLENNPLPPCHVPNQEGWKHYPKGYGFGFSSKTNDYKVVMLVGYLPVEAEEVENEGVEVEEVENEGVEGEDEGVEGEEGEDEGVESEEDDMLLLSDDDDGPPNKVKIYNLSTDSWRTLDYEFLDPYYHIEHNKHGMLFNGELHWIACKNGLPIMLSFDFSTEVFRELKLPNGLRDTTLYRSFTTLNDSLALFVGPDIRFNYGEVEDQFIEIWVMLEYGVAESWTKHVTVGPLTGIHRPLMLWRNKVILCESVKGQLLLCFVDSHEIAKLDIQGDMGLMRAMIFQESLIAPVWSSRLSY